MKYFLLLLFGLGTSKDQRFWPQEAEPLTARCVYTPPVSGLSLRTEGKELPVNTKPPSTGNISAPGGPPPSTEPVQSGFVSKE